MTQRQRVLAFLEFNGEHGVTTSEFLESFLPSFPKRIFEMRREGYEISSERLRAGSWRYTLLAKPDVERRGGVSRQSPSGAGSGSSPSLSVEEEAFFDRTIPEIAEI